MSSGRNKLKLVREADAGGRTAAIFSETKRALGVPHVNVLFQAYAAYPRFLELQWQAIEPLLASPQFFAIADRLRAEAYTRMHNYFKIPDLCARMTELSFSPGARHELTDVVELFHYNNPPLLLIAAAQMAAFDKPAPRPSQPVGFGPGAGHPVFAVKPVLVEEETASPQTRKIYEEIRRAVNFSIVNTDYRALARWPDFLLAYWTVLKPTMQSPVYQESCQGVRDTAASLAGELAFPLATSVARLQDAGLEDQEIAEIVRLTESFVKLLSGLVLNIALAKIGLEGGTEAAAKKPPGSDHVRQPAA